MGLDLVLAHPGYRYLATEPEKLEYFTGVLGLPLSVLPNRRYTSRSGAPPTTRYFVDKYPIFIDDAGTASFCFIDESAVTVAGFETYLGQYRPLWRALGRFRVIYVSDVHRLFERADRLFARSVREGCGVDAVDPLLKQMLEHFEDRFRFESGDHEAFDRQKLILLRNQRRQFSTPEHESLYERWKGGGRQAVLRLVAPGVVWTHPPSACFSSYVVDQDYRFLGHPDISSKPIVTRSWSDRAGAGGCRAARRQAEAQSQ
jgi:hypothetical protein